MTTPVRPALSGPGSSAAAWRTYAAAVSQTDGWDELSRDETIALLQEGGYLDKDGNPISKEGAESSPGSSTATPPEESESTQPDREPEPDPELDSAEPQERGLVDVPCKVCYPGGWPTKQAGQSASCWHGLSIIYGTPMEITRDEAILMGFIEDEG